MICTKSNRSCKKSERTLRFVPSPPTFPPLPRLNSPLRGGVFSLLPLPRRFAARLCPNAKFLSAEGERFELSVGCPPQTFQVCALDRYANPPITSPLYRKWPKNKAPPILPRGACYASFFF